MAFAQFVPQIPMIGVNRPTAANTSLPWRAVFCSPCSYLYLINFSSSFCYTDDRDVNCI